MSDLRLRLTLSYLAIAVLTLLLVGGVFLLLANQYAERLNRDSFSAAVEDALPLLQRLETDPADETGRLEVESRLRQDGILVRRLKPPPEAGFPPADPYKPFPPDAREAPEIGRMMRFADRYPPEPPRMNLSRQIEVRGDSVMVLRVPLPRHGEAAGAPVLLEFTRPLNSASGLVRKAEAGLAAAAGLALLISGFAGLIVARQIARPIRLLAKYAAAVEPGAPAPIFKQEGAREIRELGQRFTEMTERLSVSYRDLAAERDGLREFFSDASHELRTPLTALRNFIEIIGGPAGVDEDRRGRYAAEGLAQIGRMEGIVGRLLDMARLDGGLRPFAVEEVDLAAAVRNALVPIEALPAVEVHLGAEFRNSEAAGDRKVRGDIEALEQILANILGNALRYGHGPDGVLRLWVDGGTNPDGTMAFVRIRDAGPGVHPKDLPKLGTRFFRGRRPDGTMVSSDGLGIGLALSMRLCTTMGGFLSFTSPPQGASSGTEVSVFLPI
jgi:signal transduction histidine kinase